MATSEETMKALWEKYRPYYLQFQDGVQSAAVHVLEHAIKEMRLMDTIEIDETVTESVRDATRNMDVDIIEELISDGKVTLNNVSSQVKCGQCMKFAKGVIQTVNLPCGELYEHKRICYMCAGGANVS